jgi:hypothetical protein
MIWELLIDFGLFVLIWMVQVIIYPGFRHLGETEFIPVHVKYARVISFFVVPLMTGQLVLKCLGAFNEPGAIPLAALALVLMCWAATFFLAVPCHKKLDTLGKDLAVIDRLVRVNWIRTLGWTSVLALSLLK